MVLNKPDDYKKGLESPYGDEKPPTSAGLVGDPEARPKDVFAQLSDLDVNIRVFKYSSCISYSINFNGLNTICILLFF